MVGGRTHEELTSLLASSNQAHQELIGLFAGRPLTAPEGLTEDEGKPALVLCFDLLRTIERVNGLLILVPLPIAPMDPLERYVAGAEIQAVCPFAPVSPHCPVSIGLYGYHGSLYVGLDADATAMPDLGAFERMLADAFESLVAATRSPDD
jgi:hypothetical protein